MTILEFVGSCRAHDQTVTINIKGRPTENNLDAGYARLSQLMKCSDYSKVYSDHRVARDAQIPNLYVPHKVKAS